MRGQLRLKIKFVMETVSSVMQSSLTAFGNRRAKAEKTDVRVGHW